MPHLKVAILLAGLAAISGATASTAATFSPDTAISSSEFSASYLAKFTIDGSGMPTGFDETSAHAAYAAGNHWTTKANQTIGQTITWGFTNPRSVSGIHIWNHQSNGGIAANAYYAPTLFELELFDAGATSLLKLQNVAMAHSTNLAQFFSFGALVDDVSSATFTVLQTRYELDQRSGDTRYTGLAEVLFDTTPPPAIPLPASGWLLVGGIAALVGARRKRAA